MDSILIKDITREQREQVVYVKSKDTKMAKNMMKLVRKYVEKHYPEEADTLMINTEQYYRKFKSECPDLGGDNNMLAGNLDMGLIAFAAYEASGHRMGKEAIEELMDMRMEMLSKVGKFLDANKKYMVKLIGCPIAEFAKEHGYLELMPYLCASDHAMAKMMHAKLIRTHTVAMGSDSCDYWYVGDKSEKLKHLEEIARLEL